MLIGMIHAGKYHLAELRLIDSNEVFLVELLGKSGSSSAMSGVEVVINSP